MKPQFATETTASARNSAIVWLCALAAFLPATVVAQEGPANAPPVGASMSRLTPTGVAATRAAVAPVIDGRDDDAVWRSAPAITAFRVFRPVENGEPKFRTAAKVAYDAHYLYVFVRAFDPHPDSIVGLLARRDAMTPSDLITVFIDSFHDRRTGYEFDVNPVGVKTDYAIYQDGNEDIAWNGIWDVATRVDSLGWTAEFRIPMSQLRHKNSKSATFGFTIARMVERATEQSSWPLYRVSRPGLASQLGELTGLEGLAPLRRTEIAPYVVTKNVSVPNAAGYDRGQRLDAGADVKVAVGSNLTLTGTVNPDFGQVEADPAVLNLTAFETFFPEHRPFFVEGNGLFQFSVDCSQVNCNNEQLFYSRRIGRAPQLAGQYGDANSPLATPILGAAKLTGQVGAGLSVGLIDAVTRREGGVGSSTIEPATNYAVLRATQDFRAGASGIGLMFTGVNRDLDSWTSPVLHHEAYVGALEFRHQFLGRQYQLSGSARLVASGWKCRGHCADAARSRAPLSASGRAAGLRLDPHVAERRCGGDSSSRRSRASTLHVRDELPPAFAGLRDQRPGLPAPGRPAELEQLVRASSTISRTPCTSGCNGTSTGGNSGRLLACRPNARRTPTCIPS